MGNPQEGYIFRPVLWYNECMINAQYLAGLIDGEGYLALLPVRSKETKTQCFEPVVKIGMTGEESRRVFYAIQSTYGGHIDKRTGLSKGNRVVYTYILKSKKKVLVLVEDIIDSLYIKQEQAILLREYCKLPMSHTRHSNFDTKIVERKQEIYDEMKRLKQPPATTK